MENNDKFANFKKELKNNTNVEELYKKYSFQELMQYYEKIINDDYEEFNVNKKKVKKKDNIN